MKALTSGRRAASLRSCSSAVSSSKEWCVSLTTLPAKPPLVAALTARPPLAHHPTLMQDESDQLRRIFTFLGEPTSELWPDFPRLATSYGYPFSDTSAGDGSGTSVFPDSAAEEARWTSRFAKLRALFPLHAAVHADATAASALSPSGFKLLASCLECCPSSRVTAARALDSAWFSDEPRRTRLEAVRSPPLTMMVGDPARTVPRPF